MNKQLKKWGKFTFRWGIAAVGITWVLAKTSFHDRVMLLGHGNHPVEVRVVDGASESAPYFVDYWSGARISRDRVWTPDETASVKLAGPDGKTESAKVVAVHPFARQQPNQPPEALLVQDAGRRRLHRVSPAQVVGGYKIRVPHPVVDVGLIRLVREANPWYLLIALLVLPLSYVITSRRWHMLLETVEIHISQGLAFVLNLVGSFYNSFMPGSTGGDLVKAYYASRHTTHRTRAVMSVLIDRVIGLLALIILGGVMAALQYQIPTCRHVALISGLLILMTVVGLVVFYQPTLRRKSGLDWLLGRMPMQKQIRHAVETMEMYGRRPGVAVATLVMTFPVHMTTIVSATFAGKAFGLSLSPMYYWAIVPVITLVGAIPISPQGVGVMEPLAVELTRRQGVTVSQAFALVMAIRCCQIFWNLLAAVFVLRGGYHAPTEQQAETLEQDEGQSDRPVTMVADRSPAIVGPMPSPVAPRP